MIDDAKLLETVISEFEALTHIPRPSGHEKAVSDYLKKRFEEIGCTVTQDEALNIIAELPATKGCEAAPRTLQSRVSPTIRSKIQSSLSARRRI